MQNGHARTPNGQPAGHATTPESDPDGHPPPIGGVQSARMSGKECLADGEGAKKIVEEWDKRIERVLFTNGGEFFSL